MNAERVNAIVVSQAWGRLKIDWEWLPQVFIAYSFEQVHSQNNLSINMQTCFTYRLHFDVFIVFKLIVIVSSKH